ncbi:MAG: 5-(carboxyamino)imidazole ribonucleotide synthase [Pseudomonadota bacterium]
MRVGVIGAGQLGRMLALAGMPLGMRFTFLDPAESPCAAAAGTHVRANFDDAEALAALAASCDVVTFEFENVPAQAIADAGITLRPGPASLAAAQERAAEKTLFERIKIPVARWRAVDSQQALDAAVADLGLPLIAKTRRLGYDGKGQRRIRTAEDAAGLFAALGDVPLLVERLVDFDAELSIVGCRNADGEVVVYPLARNRHEDGILVRSETATFNTELQRQAVRHLRALAEALDYVGTLAIEFFVCGDVLLGNEFAPRVHNTGHWSIDSGGVCQFENHLRAICGLPLGRGDLDRPAGMINLLGEVPPAADLLGGRDTFLHDYDKPPRPGRKVGHITVTAADHAALTRRLDRLELKLNSA